jgi:hypothetical protein
MIGFPSRWNPPLSKPCRLLSLLAALPFTAALATGPTWEQELLGAMAAKQVPLALSADGRVRLSVDSKHVLHRVALADSHQERHVVLPFAVRALAASRTGQKVALRTDPGCVGLVDFGPPGRAGVPTLRWLEASFPDKNGEPARTPVAWSEQAPASCAAPEEQSSGDLRWPTLALSVDGRLIATEYEVVDTETHRLVASLRGGPMRIRFIEGGRRLLAQGIVMSSGYESVPDGLSEVNLAAWDLPGGALAGVLRHRMPELSTAVLSADLSSDSPVAWVIEEPATTPDDHRLVLHRWDATACGGVADAGMVIAPPPQAATPESMSIDRVVVDPLGRWVATFRSIYSKQTEELELVVQALDDARVLSRRKLDDLAGGPIATPDGTRILALDWSSSVPVRADGVRAPGDVILDFPVDITGLRAVAPPAAAPSCGVDGAPAQARDVARPVHVLEPVWRRTFAPATPPRIASSDDRPSTAPACTLPDTFDRDGGSVFLRRDGTLWADRFATLVQLDPATGKTLRTVPTPRTPQVCSTVSPAADGFFNIQGDTLTWRPLEAGTAPRRVIDQRPGWKAIELSTVDRAVRVGWLRDGSDADPWADGTADNFIVAIHDAAGRRVSQQAQSYGGYGFAGDHAEPLYGDAFMPPCADAAGPIVDAVAWQVDVFDSLRARACGAAGKPARTLLWTDTDIVPRPGTPHNARPQPVVVAHDGAIAVTRDDFRLRVFDLEQHRELGQLTVTNGYAGSIAVSAALSLMMVQVSTDSQPVVTAYRLR